MKKINKKEKIKSISHSDKIWWISVRPTPTSIIYINKILKNFDPQELGLEDCSCELGEKFSSKYNFWKNRGISFFVDNECGYIFFMEDKVNILLRKESKLFDGLRKAFLGYFEIIESPFSKKTL